MKVESALALRSCGRTLTTGEPKDVTLVETETIAGSRIAAKRSRSPGDPHRTNDSGQVVLHPSRYCFLKVREHKCESRLARTCGDTLNCDELRSFILIPLGWIEAQPVGHRTATFRYPDKHDPLS
jgi:hypothetical protein